MLEPGIHWDGQVRHALKRQRNRLVHVLVAETFIGPRPTGLQVRHLDGNPGNNRRSNLIYGTAKENARDRERHRRTLRGERHGSAKISDYEVERMRELHVKAALTQDALAKAFGISQQQVSNILRRKKRQLKAGQFQAQQGEQ